MMLAGTAPEDPLETASSTHHHWLYARVLGIYHVNVIYVGPGMVDYNFRRFEFLWVRWYQVHPPENNKLYRLDQLSFLPVTSPGAFGFVDPADVVRSCHIIPRFASGKRFPVGHDHHAHHDVGLSICGHDSHDWNCYYIGRYVVFNLGYFVSRLSPWSPSFVDRDMLMRHHWGWGIGHLYSQAVGTVTVTPDQEDFNGDDESQLDQPGPVLDLDSDDDGDHALEERENEDLGTDLEEHDDHDEGDVDDETLWTLHEMFETEVM
jgi:hypothetical protein